VYCLPVHEGATVQQLRLVQDSKITKNVNYILNDCSSVAGYKIHVWSLKIRKENRLKMSDTRVLRNIRGPRMDDVTADWRRFIMRSFMICTFY
jgi:hypothetical protein